MIVLGLVALFAANYYGDNGTPAPDTNNQTQVAK